MSCAGCGLELDEAALNCPGCQRLAHAARLEELAAEANAATAKKEWSAALQAWQTALTLLPVETRQHQAVTAKLTELEALHAAAEQDRSGALKWVAALGPVGFFLWKFKVILLIILSKGKLLLLGLTKLSTLSTMFVSLGFYWSLYGWWFALGVILSIYVHEMGHVWELRRFGIPASAPMFIPGFGALVLLKAHPATVGQDARVGLAGPIWGTAAALFCLVSYGVTHNDLWLAVARWGAWINLFNLVPVWQLDGGRAFVALTRGQRGICLGAVLAMWAITGDAVFLLVGLGGIYRMFSRDYPEEGDVPVLGRYVALVIVLGLVCLTAPVAV
ncbi:MAG: site-2 protease family protein [Acidobacteria bacterium]|nr:site-2 protease family protein [Acidobacteriota bacterium]